MLTCKFLGNDVCIGELYQCWYCDGIACLTHGYLQKISKEELYSCEECQVPGKMPTYDEVQSIMVMFKENSFGLSFPAYLRKVVK